jgi:hypothetical protein
LKVLTGIISGITGSPDLSVVLNKKFGFESRFPYFNLGKEILMKDRSVEREKNTLEKIFPKGSRVSFLYFPGKTGTVDKVVDGRVWVTVDQSFMDMKAGETAPIGVFEIEPLVEEKP